MSHTLRGEVSLPRFVGEGAQTQGHWAPLGSPRNVIEAASLGHKQPNIMQLPRHETKTLCLWFATIFRETAYLH